MKRMCIVIAVVCLVSTTSWAQSKAGSLAGVLQGDEIQRAFGELADWVGQLDDYAHGGVSAGIKSLGLKREFDKQITDLISLVQQHNDQLYPTLDEIMNEVAKAESLPLPSHREGASKLEDLDDEVTILEKEVSDLQSEVHELSDTVKFQAIRIARLEQR